MKSDTEDTGEEENIYRERENLKQYSPKQSVLFQIFHLKCQPKQS